MFPSRNTACWIREWKLYVTLGMEFGSPLLLSICLCLSAQRDTFCRLLHQITIKAAFLYDYMYVNDVNAAAGGAWSKEPTQNKPSYSKFVSLHLICSFVQTDCKIDFCTFRLQMLFDKFSFWF